MILAVEAELWKTLLKRFLAFWLFQRLRGHPTQDQPEFRSQNSSSGSKNTDPISSERSGGPVAGVYELKNLPVGGVLNKGATELRCLEGPGAPNHLRNFLARWGLSEGVALKALALGQCFHELTGATLWIISGYRSPEEQSSLLAQPDSMAAPVGRSTHTSIPATGFDIGFDFDPPKEHKAILARCAGCTQLRWGGGSPTDEDGFPVDWRHFDNGPRV